MLPLLACQAEPTRHGIAPVVRQVETVSQGQSAIVVGVVLHSKFAHSQFAVNWRNLDKFGDIVRATAVPPFCNTARCDNDTVRHVVIPVTPGRYALESIEAKWWYLTDESTSYFYNVGQRSAKPQHFEFSVADGQVVYVGDYHIRPKVVGYRQTTSFSTKGSLNISPKLSYGVDKVELDLEGAAAAVREQLPSGARISTAPPNARGDRPLSPHTVKYVFRGRVQVY